MLMRSGKVDPQDRVITQQYRYGGLNTAKLRHRMKLVPTPNCVLCGQMDGGHHSLSGCPHMSGMHIDRHNAAGRIILKALLQGGRGADVVMHDVGHGHADAMLKDTRHGGGFATRIPPWVYMQRRNAVPSVNVKRKWDAYRPDMLLVAGTNRVPIKRRGADIVEVKYCRDTDRSQQEMRAHVQHNAPRDAGGSPNSLVQSLIDAGYKPSNVRLHVILLGVGGTIYHSMHTALRHLGLKKQASDRLAGKLHRHATVYTRKIMQTKWNEEFKLKRNPG
jgi:hypothetical protein